MCTLENVARRYVLRADWLKITRNVNKPYCAYLTHFSPSIGDIFVDTLAVGVE